MVVKPLQKLALLSCMLLSVSVKAAPVYKAVPLGSLGGMSGDVRRVNALGDVVGYALTSGNINNAYQSSGGAMTALYPAPGASSHAFGINDDGAVVGFVKDFDGVRAVRFAGGSASDVGSLGGLNSEANAINNSGQIAGTSDLLNGTRHAFRSSGKSGIVDLGTLGGATSKSADINSAGVVVGAADNATGSYHAFRHSGAVIEDLGTLGGLYSEATGVNDAGAVAGFSYLMGDANAHAFVFTAGGMRDLNTLGGANSYGYGINNLGDAVGSSEILGSTEKHAFLYSKGKMVDLNSLVDSSLGYTLNYAGDINDNGQIAALGCDKLRQCQGFLLTLNDPTSSVPEPATWAMMLFGLAATLFGARITLRQGRGPG